MAAARTDNFNKENDIKHTFHRHWDKKKSLGADWEHMAEDNTQAEEWKKKQRGRQASVHYKKIRCVTGSEYEGQFDVLGMGIEGKYTFPHGVEYEGGFEDGMFHGEGVLTYPMGQKLEGLWNKGKIVAYKFSNIDGLDYEANWRYCIMPDRRFHVSIREGLQPAGREFMTNQQPTRHIEDYCYDTADGFYNPDTRSILPAHDTGGDLEDHINEMANKTDSIVLEKTQDQFRMNFVTMVPEQKHQWIIDHCRKSWDEPAGYRPDLYEHWISGRKNELKELEKLYSTDTESSDLTEEESFQGKSFSLSVESEDAVSLQYAGTGRKLEPSSSRLTTN